MNDDENSAWKMKKTGPPPQSAMEFPFPVATRVWENQLASRRLLELAFSWVPGRQTVPRFLYP